MDELVMIPLVWQKINTELYIRQDLLFYAYS